MISNPHHFRLLCTIAVATTACLSTTEVVAAKLGRLREKTAGARTEESAEKSDQRKQTSRQRSRTREEKRRQTPPGPRREQPSKNQPSKSRRVTRIAAKARHGRPAPRPRRSRPRPQRSPLGLHFSSYTTPVLPVAPPPTVITEEIYVLPSSPVPPVTYELPQAFEAGSPSGPAVIEDAIAPSPYGPAEVIVNVEEEPQPLQCIEDHATYTPSTVDEIIADDSHLAPWLGRFGFGVGRGPGNLSRSSLDMLIQRTGGFGVDASFQRYREDSDYGTDKLWLGDANVVYELFPVENVRSRAGVGFNWLSDDWGNEFGINLTASADLILTKHLVVTAETDFGTLGAASLFHARATVGFWRKYGEWYLGYDHLEIDGVEIAGVMGGLRCRF